jgi:hypothetical protein
MLKDLGCEDAFLDKQVPDHTKQEVRFACSVKGHAPFSVAIPYPNITPNMQRGSLPIMNWPQAEPSQTHKPPLEESALRDSKTKPAEANKPIVPPKDDISDAAADYDGI